MDPLDVVLNLRRSGQVERCHTFRHHDRYSVAEHCFNMVSMLLLLHPNPSITLIRATAWHDSAEYLLGDIPAPAKWRFNHLAVEFNGAEQVLLEEVTGGMSKTFKALAPEDTQWIKALDILELALWCIDQLEMGARNNVVSVFGTCHRYIQELTTLPSQLWGIRDFIATQWDLFQRIR